MKKRVTDDVKKARDEERDVKDKRRGEEGDRAELEFEKDAVLKGHEILKDRWKSGTTLCFIFEGEAVTGGHLTRVQRLRLDRAGGKIRFPPSLCLFPQKGTSGEPNANLL